MSAPLTVDSKPNNTCAWARCNGSNCLSKDEVARAVATNSEEIAAVSGNMDALATGRFGVIFVGVVGETFLPVAVRKFEIGEEANIQHYVCVRHPLVSIDYSVEKLVDIAHFVLDSPNMTLGADIAHHVKYDEEQIKIVTYQMMRALEYLHNQDIAHGTMNLKNVYIDVYQLVKISDVESNEYLRLIPYADVPLDDVQFIAPELAPPDATVTPACDIWSLGALLYAMATGVLPFLGITCETVWSAIQNGKVAEFVDDFNKIQQLVDDMLNPDPAKRIELKKLLKEGWFVSPDCWPCLIPFHHHILAEPDIAPTRSVVGRQSSNGSMDSTDCGYESEQSAQVAVKEPESDSDHESDHLGDDEQSYSDDGSYEQSEADSGEDVEVEESKELSPEEIRSPQQFEKRYVLSIGVFAIENNRQEWDPTTMILEKCRFTDGRPCLKIVIPPIRDLTPILDKEGAQQNDIQVGDYALMDFRRDGTVLAKSSKLMLFKSRRQAADYFCREEAEKVWAQLNLQTCRKCKRAKTDAFKHDGENCIYDLFSRAAETNEVVSCHRDDVFNMRRYDLHYRSDGGRVGRMKRLRRRARKVLTSMNSGVNWLRNKFHRSSSHV